MSTSSTPSTSPASTNVIHGLNYPENFLKRLRTIKSNARNPIRVLDIEDFASAHLAHLTAHAPDAVLFPFLHGLEGENHAQNQFFGVAHDRPVRVPQFRGLIWVICEDDLILHPHPGTPEDLSMHRGEDEDEDDQFSVDSSDELETDTSAMDVDTDPPVQDVHMHPVILRDRLEPITIPDYVRRGSDASSDSSPSPFSQQSAPSTSATSLPTSTSLPASSSFYTQQTHAISNTTIIQTLLTSSFRPAHLLCRDPSTNHLLPEFVPVKVPDGISLRNFGIQMPICATISDIVVYSPKGLTPASLKLAETFIGAVERRLSERRNAAGLPPMRASVVVKRKEVETRDGPHEEEVEEEEDGFVRYNVFVLDADAAAIRRRLPNLVMRMKDEDLGDGVGVLPLNTIDFELRENEEMKELTKASEILRVEAISPKPSLPHAHDVPSLPTSWEPLVGQVFVGNWTDPPIPAPWQRRGQDADEELYEGEERDEYEVDGDPFDFRRNDPKDGRGYDICIECGSRGLSTPAELRAAEEHFTELEKKWAQCRLGENQESGSPSGIRPPPSPSNIIFLRFPSSPYPSNQYLNTVMEFLNFLKRMLRPPGTSDDSTLAQNSNPPQLSHARRWSLISSLSSSAVVTSSGFGPGSRARSSSNSSTNPPFGPTTPNASPRTRPLKVLVYSNDGYTNSSVFALCLLMAVRGLSLPEAYLELQVVKRRSFFVYTKDLEALRRVEARLKEENAKGSTAAPASGIGRMVRSMRGTTHGWGPPSPFSDSAQLPSLPGARHHHRNSSMSAFVQASQVAPQPQLTVPSQSHLVRSRPRASTSPWLPSLFEDHEAWFNDPRFDGSFPSRVLPFLYLGNLNHASNAYMLHALGITHVVSVGECALVPPPATGAANGLSSSCAVQPSPNAHFVAGKGPGGQGSLWIEEREGRIKVLDIKGICDDGIDTLEPQLEPICDWIEKARAEGGQVLVHCRVGVSRSATVTIAYVMKHLNLPLVEAYLIVRSRRLSVLIQPNLRLLYNLCGWEVKLAKQRVDGDEEQLRAELARALNWPYLAKEVHLLNERYFN